MKAQVVALALLGAVAQAAPAHGGKDVARPVSKVIALLKEMQSALTKEQESDEGTYDKMQCWCNTNNKQKTAAIEEAEKRIGQLTSNIEEYSATISKLSTEIATLEKDIASYNASLSQATTIREKDRQAFLVNSKEITEASAALKAAITVLSKHNAPPAQALVNIATILRHHMHKFGDSVKTLSNQQQRTLRAFIQEPDYLGKAPTFKAGYGTQSGEIFGILGNMKDNFEADLKAATEEESRRQSEFDAVKAGIEGKINAATEDKNAKTTLLADTQKNLADAKQDLTDTRNSLGADQKFLMDLKLKCKSTDDEWAARQKTRQDEIAAVTNALAILSGDESHDLFTRTFNSFAQVSTKVMSYKAQRLSALLRRTANKVKHVDPARAEELAQLATSTQSFTAAQLDNFEKVKAAVDNLVAGLQKQKADEIAQKDWCNSEINKNARDTELKNRDKTDLDVKIQGLLLTIQNMSNEIAVLQAEIADLHKQVQSAGENREKENASFQAIVRDQKDTQAVLGKAIEVLKAFYQKAGLLQVANEPAGPAPPEGFKEYKNQGGASGVLGLLQQIQADTANLEKETIRSEKDSQSAYETFVKDTNNSIEAKNRDVVDKSAVKASAEQDAADSKNGLAGVVAEIETLTNFAAQVHQSCDFVLKNFEIRQTARDQEVEALKQAKAILSGMQSA